MLVNSPIRCFERGLIQLSFASAICVGSNALYRREALEAVGGTAEIAYSEDVHTGFYAMTRGWRVKYVPLALACGISPDNAKALFSQQVIPPLFSYVGSLPLTI